MRAASEAVIVYERLVRAGCHIFANYWPMQSAYAA